MSMSVEMILRLIDQATGPLRGVTREVDHLKKETERLNAQKAAGGVKASVYLEHQKQLAAATKAAGEYRRTRDTIIGGAVGGVAFMGAQAVAYGARELFEGSIGQAISFEKEMANVKKKIDLKPGASWAEVEKMINNTATDLGINRIEMAGLAAAAGQAGIAYEELSGFMRLAASASSAWDMGPKEAAQKLAEIKAATQMTLPQMQDFADKVNALGDKSAASERDIVSMFQRSAAASQAANVPLDTSLAALTALKSTGMDESKSATFWNAFVSTLRTAGEGGRGAKQAAEGFKALGLSVKDVSTGMKSDATRTIIDLLDRLERSPDAAAAGVKIFGKQWWDEAAQGGKSLAEIRKNLELIFSGEWKGSLAKNLATDLDTAANHLERFKSMVSQIGEEMTRWALPGINKQIENALGAYRSFKEEAAKKEKTFRDGLKGESVMDYEKRLQLNKYVRQGPAPAPTFTQTAIDRSGYHGGVADVGAGPRGTGNIANAGGGPALPTFAGYAGSGILHSITPKVDTAEMEKAARAAKTTAEDIKSALSLTVTPQVGTGQMEAALGIARQLEGTLDRIGPAARKAAAAVHAATSSVGASYNQSGLLNDAPDMR